MAEVNPTHAVAEVALVLQEAVQDSSHAKSGAAQALSAQNLTFPRSDAS